MSCTLEELFSQFGGMIEAKKFTKENFLDLMLRFQQGDETVSPFVRHDLGQPSQSCLLMVAVNLGSIEAVDLLLTLYPLEFNESISGVDGPVELAQKQELIIESLLVAAVKADKKDVFGFICHSLNLGGVDNNLIVARLIDGGYFNLLGALIEKTYLPFESGVQQHLQAKSRALLESNPGESLAILSSIFFLMAKHSPQDLTGIIHSEKQRMPLRQGVLALCNLHLKVVEAKNSQKNFLELHKVMQKLVKSFDIKHLAINSLFTMVIADGFCVELFGKLSSRTEEQARAFAALFTIQSIATIPVPTDQFLCIVVEANAIAFRLNSSQRSVSKNYLSNIVFLLKKMANPKGSVRPKKSPKNLADIIAIIQHFSKNLNFSSDLLATLNYVQLSTQFLPWEISKKESVLDTVSFVSVSEEKGASPKPSISQPEEGGSAAGFELGPDDEEVGYIDVFSSPVEDDTACGVESKLDDEEEAYIDLSSASAKDDPVIGQRQYHRQTLFGGAVADDTDGASPVKDKDKQFRP